MLRLVVVYALSFSALNFIEHLGVILLNTRFDDVVSAGGCFWLGHCTVPQLETSSCWAEIRYWVTIQAESSTTQNPSTSFRAFFCLFSCYDFLTATMLLFIVLTSTFVNLRRCRHYSIKLWSLVASSRCCLVIHILIFSLKLKLLFTANYLIAPLIRRRVSQEKHK